MDTVTLYGTPYQKYSVAGDIVYEADEDGRIPGVDPFYQGELILGGCIDEAAWLKLQAAHPPPGGLAVNAPVTPFAGGGQAGATQLAYGLCPTDEPASAGDSVALPDAVAGSSVIVFVAGSSTLHGIAIFAKNESTDTINGLASGAQFDMTTRTDSPPSSNCGRTRVPSRPTTACAIA